LNFNEIKKLVDSKVAYYNQPFFIKDDPISVPHQFTKQQDIEIAGFFAALFAWGNRKSIINSGNRLMEILEFKPSSFIMQEEEIFEDAIEAIFCDPVFVHRTFNEMDLYHLLQFMRFHYWFLRQESLETAFTHSYQDVEMKLSPRENQTIEDCLNAFYYYVFNFDEDAKQEIHCKKHIASPSKKSACKRLNMYLRWMVRKDNSGVDFGIWKTIKPSQLICPLDVHVSAVARQLGLLNSTKNDWQAAVELTENLRLMNNEDPVIYDFALFSMGVVEQKYK
jgi:uncharacterized protein (TIGR02757 family)